MSCRFAMINDAPRGGGVATPHYDFFEPTGRNSRGLTARRDVIFDMTTHVSDVGVPTPSLPRKVHTDVDDPPGARRSDWKDPGSQFTLSWLVRSNCCS